MIVNSVILSLKHQGILKDINVEFMKVLFMVESHLQRRQQLDYNTSSSNTERLIRRDRGITKNY